MPRIALLEDFGGLVDQSPPLIERLAHLRYRAGNLVGAETALDQLEAQFVRNTKNMTFTGCSMDAEAGAVEAALANLKTITTAVRAQIARSSAQASPPPK